MNSNIIYYAPFKHFIIENFKRFFKQIEKDFHNETILFKIKQFEKKDFCENMI